MKTEGYLDAICLQSSAFCLQSSTISLQPYYLAP